MAVLWGNIQWWHQDHPDRKCGTEVSDASCGFAISSVIIPKLDGKSTFYIFMS